MKAEIMDRKWWRQHIMGEEEGDEDDNEGEAPQLSSSWITPEASFLSWSGRTQSRRGPAGSKTTPEACTSGRCLRSQSPL